MIFSYIRSETAFKMLLSALFLQEGALTLPLAVQATEHAFGGSDVSIFVNLNRVSYAYEPYPAGVAVSVVGGRLVGGPIVTFRCTCILNYVLSWQKAWP